MVQINFAQKQVNAKVVYYGPGMSGKTTNLEIVHQRAPSNNRGDLTSISTDGDRTLFFDFMPLDLGTVAGMRTCFQIYTVPGQVYYNSTRKLVLQGVDGVVFVADSSAAMLEENLESLRNLEQNLNEYGKSLATVPHVIQFNKRDLPDAMPIDELNRVLNPHNAPFYEAVANTGQGVFPTLKALAARVLESIHNGARPSNGQTAPTQAQQQAAQQQRAQTASGPVAAAKTGFYGAPTTSPAAMAAAQRALQQTGFHAAVQAPAPTAQRSGAMPPPLAAQAPMQPSMPMHGGQDPTRSGAHPMPGHAQPMQPSPMMAPPMMGQAGQPGVGHGGHAAQAGLRMAGPATMTMPGHGQGQSPLQMMRPDSGKRSASPAGRSAPKSDPRTASAAIKRPGPAPAPAPVAAAPAKKSKGMLYAMIFVVVALGIGAVVAKVVLKAF